MSYAFTNQIVARIDRKILTAYDVRLHVAISYVLMREKIASLDFIDNYSYSPEHLGSSINTYLVYQDAVKLRLVKKITHGVLQNYVKDFHKKFISSEMQTAFYKKLGSNEKALKDILHELYTARNYFLEIYRIDILKTLDVDSQKKIADIYLSLRKKYIVTYPTQKMAHG